MSEPMDSDSSSSTMYTNSSSTTDSFNSSMDSSMDSTATVVVHEPLPRPPIIKSIYKTTFKHPGYEFPNDVLLVLPRFDYSSTSIQGVHYGTALTALKIIANNTVHGYLTTDRAGRQRVELDFNDILTESEYWFFVGLDVDLDGGMWYAVVPSFEDWQFPHNSPIVNWPRPDTKTIGRRCVITATAELAKETRLIPAGAGYPGEREWFVKNGMHQYKGGNVHKPDNEIALRYDLRHAFENCWFAIVPKRNHYVVHQFHDKPAGLEFATIYHNRIIQQLGNVPPEFLFASFARTVLAFFTKQCIIRSHVPRYVAVFRGWRPEMQFKYYSTSQLYYNYSIYDSDEGDSKSGDEGDSESSDDESVPGQRLVISKAAERLFL
ncbi:hypothetical protein F4680DRAFT_453939 [Xylaria scruposa]|nr:hypothetical protein F4680DRAFT_453939 [Xylaria scruposa]